MTATLQTVNLDGNDAAVYTLDKIRELIEKYKTSPEIRVLYSNILKGIDGRDTDKIIRAVDDYAQKNIRYQKDIYEVETLQSPLRTLSLGFGDCDDFTIVIGTLLEGAGIPTRIVLVSIRPDRVFHHVFPQSYNGREWITVDPVEKYTGPGFKRPLTNYHIEGGAKDMSLKLLTLEGIEDKNGSPYFQISKKGNQKKITSYQGEKQKTENLGMMVPVLLGDGTLGWFGSKIVKAVSSAVSSAVNVAKSAVSAAYNTAKMAAETAAKYAQNPLAIVNDVKNTVEAVAKNTINAAIHGDLEALAKTASIAFPQAALLTSAIQIIKDPSKLLDPKALADLAISTAVPANMKAYANIAKTAITNPGALLDPSAMITMAANYAIPADTMAKLNQVKNAISDPKQLIQESLKILGADSMKDIAKNTLESLKQAIPAMNIPESIKKAQAEVFTKIDEAGAKIKAINNELKPIADEVNDYNQIISNLMRKNGQIYFDADYLLSQHEKWDNWSDGRPRSLREAIMAWGETASMPDIKDKTFFWWTTQAKSEFPASPLVHPDEFYSLNPDLINHNSEYKRGGIKGFVGYFNDFWESEKRYLSKKNIEIRQKEAVLNAKLKEIDSYKDFIGNQTTEISKQLEAAKTQESEIKTVPGQKSNAEIQASLANDFGDIAKIYLQQAKEELEKI